jgi:hypothetical protein
MYMSSAVVVAYVLIFGIEPRVPEPIDGSRGHVGTRWRNLVCEPTSPTLSEFRPRCGCTSTRPYDEKPCTVLSGKALFSGEPPNPCGAAA